MSSHYGVELIDDAHKNAVNVVFGLVLGFNPSTMECFPIPANVSGSENDPFTHWYGGQEYSTEDVTKLQSLVDSIPGDATWPIAGADGSVTLLQAQAAAAAMILTVTTRDVFTTQQAADTLAAALTAQGLKKIVFE